MISEDAKFLSSFKQFGRILSAVKSFREEAISDLNNADPSRISQISGKIVAYDEIMKMTDAEEVIRRCENLP
jgi:hypothetical protein